MMCLQDSSNFLHENWGYPKPTRKPLSRDFRDFRDSETENCLNQHLCLHVSNAYMSAHGCQNRGTRGNRGEHPLIQYVIHKTWELERKPLLRVLRVFRASRDSEAENCLNQN